MAQTHHPALTEAAVLATWTHLERNAHVVQRLCCKHTKLVRHLGRLNVQHLEHLEHDACVVADDGDDSFLLFPGMGMGSLLCRNWQLSQANTARTGQHSGILLRMKAFQAGRFFSVLPPPCGCITATEGHLDGPALAALKRSIRRTWGEGGPGQVCIRQQLLCRKACRLYMTSASVASHIFRQLGSAAEADMPCGCGMCPHLLAIWAGRQAGEQANRQHHTHQRF